MTDASNDPRFQTRGGSGLVPHDVRDPSHEKEAEYADPGADYFGAKADKGKAGCAFIPWEVWERWGAPAPFVEALRVWQRAGRAGDERELVAGLLTPDCADSVARVLDFGAKKYAANSWRNVPDAIDRYRHAMARHQLAILAHRGDGEPLDLESMLPHRAHRDCCAAFLYALLGEVDGQ